MERTASADGLLDGRYQVESVIGGGASAVVYLGRQTSVDRSVAIKVIRPEVFANERELERYLREAKIVGSLNHPNIVTLYDVGRLADHRPYMVMEYVKGASLQRLLQNDGHLPVDVAFQVFQQVADALGHAHRHGVVHRDIKPGNILIEHRSTGLVHARVADFGVASVANSALTHAGAFIGTPLYMAPEQALGLPVTPQADIYSLGVLMYRTLTGVKPFDADTPVALAMRHVTQAVPRMGEVAPAIEIPAELEAVVLRCMSKEPADRYASCQDLVLELMDVKARILPHLLGMSQESLEGPLLLEELPATPSPTMWSRAVAVIAAASLTFLAGVMVGQSPSDAPAVVRDVEHVLVEVPVASHVSYIPPADVNPRPSPTAALVVPEMVESTPEPVAEVDVPAAEVVLPSPVEPVSTRLPALEPRVGLGGIRSRWLGQVDGKAVAIELRSDPGGHVAARVRTRSGPSWTSRDMVGQLEARGDDRVELTLADLDARQDVSLRVMFARDHGWGTYAVGGKDKELVVRPD